MPINTFRTFRLFSLLLQPFVEPVQLNHFAMQDFGVFMKGFCPTKFNSSIIQYQCF